MLSISAVCVLQTIAFVPSPRTSTLTTSTSYEIHNAIRHSSKLILSDSPSDNDGTTSLASEARRALIASTAAALSYSVITLGAPAYALLKNPEYEKVSPLQFVAALGDPDAASGNGAENWGLWPTDPGPRGLRLRDYAQIQSGAASAPSWLNSRDFFLDENAIIMPQPEFPMPPGKYLVTGARAVTTGLTIQADGSWKLDDGAKLYDVTHLPCRAARYIPGNDQNGSPSTVRRSDFPVAPGGIMPEVSGTKKQDYAVIFIVGKQKQSV